MAEEKKKKNPLLERFKQDMNTKESLAKLQERAKQESLASSKNKKLSEPAKRQLQITKNKEEDEQASAAMKESRKTIEALSNRATLRNYGGSSGPAETEGKVDKPAAPTAKTKPQATKPTPKAQPGSVKPTAPAKPAAKETPKVKMPKLFDRRRMTPATSELFIGDKAAQAMKQKPKAKPKRRGQGGRR